MPTPHIEVTQFAPPYAHRGANPKGFSYYWMQIQYLFNFPDPYLFPTVGGFTEDEQTTLARYVRNCAELAESTLLSYDGGLIARFDGATNTVTTESDSVPKDALRGAAVLFRLISAENETGGHGRARRVLEHRVATSDQSSVAARIDELKAWRRARGKLSARMLKQMVSEKMFEDKIGGYPSDLVKPGPSPVELISLFDYGDLIHQGRQLEAFETSRVDQVGHAFTALDHVLAVLQLSHFYLGYAVLIESSLGRSAGERM